MKSSFLFVLAAAAACSFYPVPAHADQGAVHYVVGPKFASGALEGLTIELRFPGDADGQTDIYLPRNDFLGGQPASIGDITAIGGVLTPGSGHVTVAHAPGVPITLRYVVRPQQRQGAGRPATRFWIEPSRFTTTGWAVLASVSGRGDEKVSFAWAGFPKDWKLVSDLETDNDLTQGDAGSSILLGGTDLNVFDTGAKSPNARLAVHEGPWSFKPDEMASFMGKVIDAAKSYWGEVSQNHVIALTPLVGDPTGRLAYGLDDVAMIWSGTAMSADVLFPYATHEYTHSRVPTAIGSLTGGSFTSMMWLVEGVNDFAAYATLLHGSVWSYDQFAQEYNRILSRYGISPVRDIPLQEMGQGYTPNSDMRQLHYSRGSLLAALWNAKVREATQGRASLKDVLRAAVVLAKENPSTPAVTNLDNAFGKVAGFSIEEDVRRHIDRGETIRLPENAFGSCARVLLEDTRRYEQGFALVDGIIRDVDPASAAHAAGIRDGMRFIGRVGGGPGDPTSEAHFRVADAEGEKIVRYLPASRAIAQVQRIALMPIDAAAKEKCAAFVSGR